MSHLGKAFVVAVLTVWPSFYCVQASAQGDATAKTVDAEQSNAISDGDMLEVTVYESPDLSAKVRVGEGGEALLPVAGPIHLQGLNVADASAAIRTRLMEKRIVKDPKVTVGITEYATRGVSVLGEVKKPGIYTAMGSHRLNDYISLSEGLTPQAGTHVSITHRNAPEETTSVRISSTGKATPGSNPLIESGDTIVVPKAGQVYIVGDVVRPGEYLMDHDEQLTIMQALALAQGANRTALMKHAVIVRKTDAGRTEIPVDISKILTMKSKDLTLADNDILFIPVSKMKSAVNRSVEAIVQTAVGAASYRAF
jgi:polysaccharide export outer membrane protein